MSNQFTKEWCRLAWQVLLYLESVYDSLNDQGLVIARSENWYAQTEDEEDEEEACICFEVKPANVKKIKGNFLWVGLWFKEEGIKNDRPIWIEVFRDDPKIWQQLKNEFQEGLVYETEECWAVGLEWKFPENASNDEIRAAGRNLADRITKVLVSTEGKNGT